MGNGIERLPYLIADSAHQHSLSSNHDLNLSFKLLRHIRMYGKTVICHGTHRDSDYVVM